MWVERETEPQGPEMGRGNILSRYFEPLIEVNTFVMYS